MANLILLAGLPGAGKSTWAKTFFDLKCSIVSSDAIRKRLAGSLKDAHNEGVKPWDVFYQDIEDRLRHQVDVIADATFLTYKHRDRAREVARRTNSKLHFVLFKNWWEADQRNRNRDEDAQVPATVFADMMKLYWDTLAACVREDYDTVTMIESFA